MKTLVFVVAFLPNTVFAADDSVTLYGPALAQCHGQAEGTEAKTQCIGVLAQECIEQEDGGETRFGISMCNSAETEFWDGLLNEEYQQTMAWAKQQDVEEAKYSPDSANLTKSLRDAQRAWIGFRDAECELAHAIWGSGSMRNIAASGCFLNMAAKRAIELLSKREYFE